MPIILRTSSGLWKAIVRSLDRPALSRTFSRRLEAVAWAEKVESFLPSPSISLAPLTFRNAWLRYANEVTPLKKPLTQIAELRRARRLLHFFADLPLESISPADVARYRDARLEATNEGNGQLTGRRISPSTVRLELALLSHICSTAIREWQVENTSNPVSRIRRPRANPGRCRRLRPDEQRRLERRLSEYVNPMLHWAFRIALETGMRAGEIRTLTTSQVDIRRRVITLWETKNGSSRSVPLSEQATAVLKEAIAHGRPAGCTLLFPGSQRSDGTYSAYRFEHAWWRTKKKLGIEDLHFHDLRHEAISRLVEAGLSDLEVSAISGHRSMQMLKRYTHLRSEDLVATLDRQGYGRMPGSTGRRCRRR